jgi:YD repeat-containing protein
MPATKSRFHISLMMAFLPCMTVIASGVANAQVFITIPVDVNATADPDDSSPTGTSGSSVTMDGISSPVLRRTKDFAIVKVHAYTSDNKKTSTNVNKDASGCQDIDSDPVVLSNGTKVMTYTDFALPGEMGLNYTRFYNTANDPKSTNSFSYSLDTDCQGNTPCHGITVFRPDGSSEVFSGAGAGSFGTFQSPTSVASLTHNTDGTYTLQDEDTTTQTYSADGHIQSIKDLSGIGWTFAYPSGTTTVVTHTNGQSVTVSLSTVTTGLVTVTDPAGNVYTYDEGPDVVSATLPGSPATVISYKYTSIDPLHDDMLSEVDYNGVPYAYTSYNTLSQVSSTYLADNSQLTSMAYGVTSDGFLQTTVTNPLGHVTTNVYGSHLADGFLTNLLTSISDNAVSTCGATTHARVYDANSHLFSTTDNNGNVHTYNYAVNGQLQAETEAFGQPEARTTNYVWDPNAQLNRPTRVTVVGWSQTDYTYNAQNRVASVTVTNLSGSGTAGQALTTSYNYTLYANGMVHTVSVTHPSPSNSDTDVTTYDALGNVTSVANGLGQTTTYSNYTALGEPQQVTGFNGDTTNYTYDARGRVVTKTTHPNGTAATWNYTYDGFGLLFTETTPDNEVTTWNRTPEMLVHTITHNDKDGTSTETFGYDVNGDVTSDVVTRGTTTALSWTANYDALGRLYQKFGSNGQSLTYFYDGNGNVLSVTNAAGHVITYQYDHLNRVTATAESGGASPLMPSAAPTLTTPATSSTGSYTVSWTTVSGALAYNLQKEVNGGAWALVLNTGSTSWSAASQPSGTYGYRVQACDSAGCGPWSATGTTTVSIPTAPATAPALSVPASSTTGSYTVSWSSVSGAGSYTLQQLVNGGGWTVVSASAATSWNASGEASGSYSYQVQACNAVGCGPWSGVGTDTVTLPPIPATPSLTTPATNATGSYTVSWTGVSNATSYTMQEQVNGGGWTTVSASAATSWAASVPNGTYGYRVQACGFSGCSAWSGTSTTVVTIPVPIAINGQFYQEGEQVAQGTGFARIGFAIAGGNTWQVFESNGTLVNSSVVVSGAVPATAVTVQYTWTLEGAPSGDLTAGGAVINGAASPTAISSNPSSEYTTTGFGSKSVERGDTYQLIVTFFNAAGANVSSSTATMTATVVGSE